MAIRYCLNVGMEGIGILVIRCCTKYPPTTIPIPPCPSIRLADFLANEEISWAHDGYIVARVERDYSEFIQIHLQGFLAGITVLLFPSEVKFSSCKFFFHIFA